MKIAARLAALLLAAAFATGPAQAQALREITIAHTPSLAGGIPKVAVALGLFEAHGLEAKLVQMESASATATALISGSVDATVTGPGELIAAQARGVDMVMVANLYNGFNGSIVISKAVAEKLGVAPDAPVEERLKALDGLVIGSTSATSAFTVTPKSAIESVGGTPRFIYMSQPAMQAAMESGGVQAYMAGAPFWTMAVQKGTGIVWISGPKGEFPKPSSPSSSVGLEMMRDAAEADPELAQALAGVFADLSKAFEERPEEVKAAISEAFPAIDRKTIDAFYDSEIGGFMAKPLTTEEMAHEIAFVKLGGANLPNIDDIDPASLSFP